MTPSSSEGGAAPSAIPTDIQANLSQDQVQRLDAMLLPRRTEHAVDYRVSSDLFGRRFYLTLFAGSENRSQRRLQDEGQTRSLGGVAFELSMICLAVAMLIVGSLGVVGLAIKAIYDHTH
jgi:hypothetical protein